MRIAGYAISTSLLIVCACSTPQVETMGEPSPNAQDPQAQLPEGLRESLAKGPVVEASMTQPQDANLQDVAEKLSLQQQATKLLVEQHLANAQSYLDTAQLEKALEETEAALSLERDSLAAQNMAARIAALMGESTGESITAPEFMEQAYNLRVQQIHSQAQDFYQRGQLALTRNDYDEAITELTLAVSSIRGTPYKLDWDGLDARAAELLERAKAEKSAAEDRIRMQEEREAFEELQALPGSQADRQSPQDSDRFQPWSSVRRSMPSTIESLRQGRDRTSLTQALRSARSGQLATRRGDPRRRPSAPAAKRDQLQRSYIAKKRREEFKDWNARAAQRMMRSATPSIITHAPIVDDWRREERECVAKRPGLDSDPTMTMSPLETGSARSRRDRTFGARCRSIEDESRVSTEVIGYILRSNTGLPMIVDPAAEDVRRFDEVDRAVQLRTSPNAITVEQALNRTRRPPPRGEDAGVTWTDALTTTIFVTTARRRRSACRSRDNHEVKDLMVCTHRLRRPADRHRIRLLRGDRQRRRRRRPLRHGTLRGPTESSRSRT